MRKVTVTITMEDGSGNVTEAKMTERAFTDDDLGSDNALARAFASAYIHLSGGALVHPDHVLAQVVTESLDGQMEGATAIYGDALDAMFAAALRIEKGYLARKADD